MNRLDGKTALVTGAARGLGFQIARRFAEEGARVYINDRDPEQAKAAAEKLGATAAAADVSSAEEVAAMFAGLDGPLDILVNNAGISGLEGRNDIPQIMERRMRHDSEVASDGPIETFLDATVNTTDEAWRRMQAIHVDGTFYCCRAALKLMGPEMSGSIVNMSSVLGTLGRAGNVAYATAKAAILGLTRSLAHDVAPRNIRVNAIAPGWIATDMTDPLAPLHPGLRSHTPLRRIGEPDDIAWAAVYLASDEAKFMTGQVISPNGGWYMSQ